MLLAGTNTIKRYLEKYLDNVSEESSVVTITRKNKENVVMISESEYQELLEQKEQETPSYQLAM